MASIPERLTAAASDIGVDAAIQAGVSLALVATVLAVARWVNIDMDREALWAAGRGLLQVIIVGFVLAAILSLHVGWSVLVLGVMVSIAAGISRKRAASPRAYAAAWMGIALGAGLVLVVMVAMGALDTSIRDLVPVGSIFIAGCMRTASLAFERLEREASDKDAGATAVRASLIPAVDGMRSLGFVWIPGVMTGLILAGASPVRAAFLQFAVVALGFVAAAITSLVATTWSRQAARDVPT